jgi:hypothetical protein
MGWRYYRRRKILPGLYINFSKRGVSFSAKAARATVNVNPKRKRVTRTLNVGGGLSYRDSRRLEAQASPLVRFVVFIVRIFRKKGQSK